MIELDYIIRPTDGICCTQSAKAALGVLLSDDFGPLKIPEYYDRIAAELGRDFPNIRFVARFVPLMYSGPKHRELRRQGAIYLRARAQALAQFELNVADLFAEKLSRPGRVEIISEIIEPVFEMAAEAISGLPYSADAIRVFTAFNSLKMSHKIDTEFAALRKSARERFSDDSADTHGMRVAFSVLGVAPIGASLAKSLEALLPHANPVPIQALNWGETFVATGLPAVGRESLNGPVDLEKGAESVQVCEVDLSQFLQQGGQENYIFGAGAHACLGRSSALSLWSRIGEALAQNSLRIRLIEAAPPTQKIIDYPSKLLIEVLP